ncbi:hypothetical protein ACKWTF_007298 [Chironomus riparius]
MELFKFFILISVIYFSNALSDRDLFNINAPGSTILERGNDNSKLVNLQNPINFYTEKYDSIYINSNGILTFVNEFPEFLNIPFPIEYPSISPFYSNIDTTYADQSSTISYYESTDASVLATASHLIRNSFSDASSFYAKSIFVATWFRVPKWKSEESEQERSNEFNTFQVAIISSDDQSYAEFLYPQNGIQWVQADTGESGLPDIRARAGFVAADGRYTLLKGAGTDRIRNLKETSNSGENGRWLYRVGKLLESESVKEPDNIFKDEDIIKPTSCSDGGRLQCHVAAICEDQPERNSFCCKCKDDYYGNGFNCIKSTVPIRVIGQITGQIGSKSISAPLQAYVVMQDGRIYAAISSLNGELGSKVQLIEVIGGVVGWLFAKPFSNTLNGYQITGGVFNHTSSIRFNTGENLQVTQRFIGLNLWDQLAAEIEINGDVPEVKEGVKLYMDESVEEYTVSGINKIQSVSSKKIELSSGDPDIEYTIYQDIVFDSCSQLPNVNTKLKSSKVSLGYFSQENAVRISSINKIGLDERSNPCTEGTANCGDNTICIPTEDAYECQCKNGFVFASNGPDRDAPEICVDIDECSGNHICSEYAECINRIGGYDCICLPEYYGNGYDCQRTEVIQTTPRTPPPPVAPCRDCSENAQCLEGVCVCNQGFIGNGQDCSMICAMNEMFDGEKCIKNSELIEEDEVKPYCTQTQCVCPRGYKLFEYAFGAVCRYDDTPEETAQHPVSCDVVNNCHPYANCEFDQNMQRYQCVCAPGYDGNGIDCTEVEANCAQEDICDIHADCVYNVTLRKSACLCQEGYEGDGRTCNLAAECRTSAECTDVNSFCNQGVCECAAGYERDNSDLCVPAGSCNGAYCAENAYCRFDDRARVHFCYCPDGFVGDGVTECKSVPPTCNVRNNCGLYASCVPNYRTSSYQCTCNDGYKGDGFVCVAEYNCNNIPELCDVNAHCTQNFGKYQCVCNQGFIGNGSICTQPPKHETGFLIVSQGVATVKVSLSANKRSVPVSTAMMAIGVDKDCAEGRVYWSDISAKAIFSAKYDGTDKKPFINENIMSPEGVAVDWIGRKLYWTDSAKDTIEVASLENSTLRSVLINRELVNPRGIAVDPLQNKLYWSDWNRKAPKIEWSNLDGTDRQTLLSFPNVKLPNSLALSLSSGEICYADAGNQKIECLDTYTQQPRLIADNLSYPFGLAITDDHFYWSDWTTKKIESIDFNGVRQTPIQVLFFSSHKTYGVTAVIDRCPIDYNACSVNNGDCPADNICLVNRMSPSGKSCKCITNGACNILSDQE